MKSNQTKLEYIKLRAEGLSYDRIAAQLHIAKSTCKSWEADLAEQIDDLKRQNLSELCESYGATREARIKSLGEMLKRIDAAIAEIDLTTVEPAKLLDFKLKYAEALKEEYATLRPESNYNLLQAGEADTQLEVKQLINRVRTGTLSAGDALKESKLLELLHEREDQHIEVRIMDHPEYGE